MTAAPPRASAWQPLALPLFRALWIASVASNIGTWMQNVGAAWLMTSLSTSPTLVAMVQTATSLPVFLLGVPAGALADLVDRRRLLIATQAWMLGAAGLLGLVTLAGLTTPWLLLLLTFALGLGAALNAPAWQAIVSELVPREQLPAAISLNSVGFNLARAIGPALSGFLISWTNPGIAFVLNAVSFLGVIVVLYQWHPNTPVRVAAAERWQEAIRAGFRYVRHDPALQTVLIRAAVFIFGGSALWALLPLLARNELKTGSEGYGLLLACFGIGSVGAASLLPMLRARMSNDRLVASATALFGCVCFALGWWDSLASVCALMLAGGMAWMAAMSSLNTSAQLVVPGWVRARALAFYLLVFQGGLGIGSIVWGRVADRWGIKSALIAAGVTSLVGLASGLRYRLANAQGLDVSPATPVPEPAVLIEPTSLTGPVLVMVEYRVVPEHYLDFERVMQTVGRLRRRDGAMRWLLFQDAAEPGRCAEMFLVESWAEHLRQHGRGTVADRVWQDRALAFHAGPQPPVVTHWVASE